MRSTPLPDNEPARLEALRQYEILDTDEEGAFDDLTRIAAYICQTPIAIISLVDKDRQWFKARLGLGPSETSRDVAFCSHTILQGAPMVVPDALVDERFAANPLVTSEPYIRLYAGAPLITPEGFRLGSLCVIDRVPRNLSPDQIAVLRMLSNQVMTLLDLRREKAALQRSLNEHKRLLRESSAHPAQNGAEI